MLRATSMLIRFSQILSKLRNNLLIVFCSVWKVLFPSIHTSSYFCGLIEQLEACFLEMKMAFLSFTELWIFVVNAPISAKNVRHKIHV